MILLALAFFASAQQPYSTLPRNYSLAFENDWVRVSRVKYSPGDRLPVHSHPSIPTIYVYLTDGGPIRFTHITPKVTIVRGEVKTGQVRFNRNARVETHETEYQGDAPSEYLRVELKTVPGPPHLDARLIGEADFPWEDPQVRISRFHGPPPELPQPSILVNLSTGSFTWMDPRDKRPHTESHEAGWFVLLELKTGRAG
jgi:hypothetical protein